MVVDPKKLIAAIVPDVYCSEKTREEVKKIVKDGLEKGEKDVYLKAAEKAELVETDFMDFDKVVSSPFKNLGIKNPVEQHTLVYETSSQALEQVYFWLHDYLYNKAEYGSADKIIDNFISAPGSAHFSEMGLKASKMQEEGMKILALANQLIRSILNLVYDLKEMKLRLQVYDDFKDKKDSLKSEAAYISLKQIWLDQVDAKRGNTSIKGLAISGTNQPSFVMLIDSFMVVKSLEDIDKREKNNEFNERISRLLKQRFSEFERWLKESDRELRKRFEIEKSYLKSQVNSIKLYAHWAKPYLKAAAQLEQRAKATSALVNMFNTSLFELALLGIGDYKVDIDVARKELPKSFKGSNKKKLTYTVLVELKFRSIPERFQQGGYGFRGNAEVIFTGFALSADEQRILKDQLDYDDFKDVYSLIEGTTEGSLAQLQSDIDEFLAEKKEEKKSEESGETNPFSALISIFTDAAKLFKKEEKKEEEKEKSLKIEPDSDMEKVMRSQCGVEARRRCRKFYDSFKKTNNSPAFQS